MPAAWEHCNKQSGMSASNIPTSKEKGVQIVLSFFSNINNSRIYQSNWQKSNNVSFFGLGVLQNNTQAAANVATVTQIND